MKLFVRNILLFAALQASIGAALILAFRPDPDGYLAATVDKNERLRTAASPRIVFIGGSNLAFGMDSERIAEALPYEPVNMGLHGGLGLRFMLAEAAAGLRPGDVALLVIEYELFARDTASDALLETLGYRPASIRLLSADHIGAVLDSALTYFGHVARKGIRRLEQRPPRQRRPPYSRSSFNAMGDVVAHRRLEPRAWTTKKILQDGLSERNLARAVEMLDRFQALCAKRGVEVLFAFASVPRPLFESVEPEIRRIRDRLASEGTFPLLLEPEEVVLPEDCFFDSPYHLNGRGTELRMKLLLPALTRALEGRGGSAQTEGLDEPLREHRVRGPIRMRVALPEGQLRRQVRRLGPVEGRHSEPFEVGDQWPAPLAVREDQHDEGLARKLLVETVARRGQDSRDQAVLGVGAFGTQLDACQGEQSAAPQEPIEPRAQRASRSEAPVAFDAPVPQEAVVGPIRSARAGHAAHRSDRPVAVGIGEDVDQHALSLRHLVAERARFELRQQLARPLLVEAVVVGPPARRSGCDLGWQRLVVLEPPSLHVGATEEEQEPVPLVEPLDRHPPAPEFIGAEGDREDELSARPHPLFEWVGLVRASPLQAVCVDFDPVFRHTCGEGVAARTPEGQSAFEEGEQACDHDDGEHRRGEGRVSAGEARLAHG